MKTSYEHVRELHQAFGAPVADELTTIPAERLRLRLTLIAEEVAELVCAMTDTDHMTKSLSERLTVMFTGYALCAHDPQPDLAAIAKEAVDVHVVTSGIAVEYGIPEDAVYMAVAESNLAKVGGPTREDGKSLKPDGWRPPDVAGVLARHAR